MGEVLFIITLIVGLIGWVFLIKNKKARIYWLITMSGCGAVVGTMEIVAKCREGMTISQMFWRDSVYQTWQPYVAMGILGLGIASLIIHLLWKKWTDPDYKKKKG